MSSAGKPVSTADELEPTLEVVAPQMDQLSQVEEAVASQLDQLSYQEEETVLSQLNQLDRVEDAAESQVDQLDQAEANAEQATAAGVEPVLINEIEISPDTKEIDEVEIEAGVPPVSKIVPRKQGNIHVPHVTHDDYHEITLRAVVLSAILSVVLGAANIYLGLLVGLTVSASIPASVMSMAILRCFKNPNILENNIVQTAASAGEALAAGIIFTLPGLTIMNNERDKGNEVFAGVEGWESFMGQNYVYGAFLAMFGGLLGIAWSVPLRKALIIEIKPPLKFPEGVATAEVLKSGEKGGNSVKAVGAGAGLGGVLSLFETMGFWYPTAGFGWFYNNSYPSFFALNVKPALLGVGYIVGPNIAFVLFIGAMTNNWVIIPLSAAVNGHYEEAEWNSFNGSFGEFVPENVWYKEFGQTRYIGVGMMLIGGVWSLVSIRKALFTAVKTGIQQLQKSMKSQANVNAASTTATISRTDRDIPIHFVGLTILMSIVPLGILFATFTGEAGYSAIMAVFVAITSFLFSAVAAYMAGLVGSSNNPVSGVTICSSLILSGLILAMFGKDNPVGPSVAVMMACAVATACAISGDNMQDLKSGYILGATPWKQEIVMSIGVITTALVAPPILELLDSAYVLGEGLQAPQATVIATVPSGLISGTLPWTYINIGIGLGILTIIIDSMLAARDSTFRLPVLAFAISTYLPGEYLIPIFVGSLVHFVAKTDPENQASEGVLFSAGLVAGDSLLGILLAIPIVITSDSGVLTFVSEPQVWPVIFPLIILFGSMSYVAKYQPFTGNMNNKRISNGGVVNHYMEAAINPMAEIKVKPTL